MSTPTAVAVRLRPRSATAWSWPWHSGRPVTGPPARGSWGRRRRLEAAMRIRQLRKAGKVSHASLGKLSRAGSCQVLEVLDLTGGVIWLVSRVDQSICGPGERSELDRHDIVEDAAAIRDTGSIAP